MNRCRRTIFFIDRKVQGTLALRVAGYWLFWLLSMLLMLICWDIYSGPTQRFNQLVADIFHRYGPALVASFILLPIVMMDVVRLSNRFVGPVMRLRGALKALAAGKEVQPMHFRDDDFWRELASDLNEVAARLNYPPARYGGSTEPMQLAEAADELDPLPIGPVPEAAHH